MFTLYQCVTHLDGHAAAEHVVVLGLVVHRLGERRDVVREVHRHARLLEHETDEPHRAEVWYSLALWTNNWQ